MELLHSLLPFCCSCLREVVLHCQARDLFRSAAAALRMSCSFIVEVTLTDALDGSPYCHEPAEIRVPLLSPYQQLPHPPHLPIIRIRIPDTCVMEPSRLSDVQREPSVTTTTTSIHQLDWPSGVGASRIRSEEPSPRKHRILARTQSVSPCSPSR